MSASTHVRQAAAGLEPASRRWFGFWLFLPSAVVTVAVGFYPVAYAAFTSLFRTRYLDRVAFVGLDNYARFLADPLGRASVANTFVFVMGSVLLAVPLGGALALVLNRPLRGRGLLRALIVLPWVVTLVVVGMIWNWLLNPQYGPVTYAAARILGWHVNPFGEPGSAMAMMIVANVWQSYPYAMLLILAGLQSIPPEIYEAARVDGASRTAVFVHVTLPWLREVLLVTVVMLSIHYFNVVTLPLVLTDGGPANGTLVMSLQVFHEAFTSYDVGYACAVSMCMFLFNAVFSLIYMRMIRGGAVRA
jgi:ABC-type sugar transport system permease subunit